MAEKKRLDKRRRGKTIVEGKRGKSIMGSMDKFFKINVHKRMISHADMHAVEPSRMF